MIVISPLPAHLPRGKRGAKRFGISHGRDLTGVEVLFAAEAVGKIVAGIDGSAYFAAVGAEEAEVAFVHFRRRALGAQGGMATGMGKHEE
jgi:hypothetical protein